MRGRGALAGDALVLEPSDASGTTLVSINTDFRSSDYRAIAWDVSDVPPEADVRMLWRSDFAPQKMNSIPVAVAAGRVLPVGTAGDPNWIGRIKGVALAIRVDRGQPVRMRGIVAKPMGANEIVGDRMREWLAFESWSGTSVDGVAGGADVQDLPLPLLLATAAALAMGASFLLLWRCARKAAMPAAIGSDLRAAWFALDARWAWNLVRQARRRSAVRGQGLRDKHLAAEDGALFAFIEQARAAAGRAGARLRRGRRRLFPRPRCVSPVPAQRAVRSLSRRAAAGGPRCVPATGWSSTSGGASSTIRPRSTLRWGTARPSPPNYPPRRRRVVRGPLTPHGYTRARCGLRCLGLGWPLRAGARATRRRAKRRQARVDARRRMSAGAFLLTLWMRVLSSAACPSACCDRRAAALAALASGVWAPAGRSRRGAAAMRAYAGARSRRSSRARRGARCSPGLRCVSRCCGPKSSGGRSIHGTRGSVGDQGPRLVRARSRWSRSSRRPTGCQRHGGPVAWYRRLALPGTVPLLQVWSCHQCSAAGTTRSMNCPGGTRRVALALAIYGFLRGSARSARALRRLLVASLPLLNVHIALAGYADLPLAAVYAWRCWRCCVGSGSQPRRCAAPSSRAVRRRLRR